MSANCVRSFVRHKIVSISLISDCKLPNPRDI